MFVLVVLYCVVFVSLLCVCVLCCVSLFLFVCLCFVSSLLHDVVAFLVVRPYVCLSVSVCVCCVFVCVCVGARFVCLTIRRLCCVVMCSVS